MVGVADGDSEDGVRRYAPGGAQRGGGRGVCGQRLVEALRKDGRLGEIQREHRSDGRADGLGGEDGRGCEGKCGA